MLKAKLYLPRRSIFAMPAEEGVALCWRDGRRRKWHYLGWAAASMKTA